MLKQRITLLSTWMIVSHAFSPNTPLRVPVTLEQVVAEEIKLQQSELHRYSKIYDLGIGRNGPLSKEDDQHYNFGGLNEDDVTAYWVGYESVRSYPAPYQMTRKKVYPKLIPNRITDDTVLTLSRKSADSVDATGHRLQGYEMNTAWVEMLIDQQRQLLIHIC